MSLLRAARGGWQVVGEAVEGTALPELPCCFSEAGNDKQADGRQVPSEPWDPDGHPGIS